ncbi:MAG: hypothetical protein K8W52_31770 [Deltaproteobacteria bacterium]|nr:hypothetical protein [Deltaproteobacteria bacterium]
MPIPVDRRRSHLARQVGTMALSCVQVDNPMALVRAASWTNALGRLGLHLPLFVVHDLGVLFTAPRGPGGWIIRTRDAQLAQLGPSAASRTAIEAYRRMLETIAGSEVTEKLAGARLRDELVAVLITRALADVYNRWRDRGKAAGVEPLPLDLGLYAEVDYAELAREFDTRPLWAFLDHLVSQALHVYTQIELIDLDTVRLLGLFKDDTGKGGAIDLVDLFSALGSPEAHDIANFSLDLLPSVLETRRASGIQSFAVDGYASIERKGNVDSLVLSELAYDREIFEQKIADHELLYYGHERQRDDERRLQYILVDASASMRGQRQVFARGLALTLVKKLSLEGDEVWFRFFDARLHETVKITRSGQVPVPYVLSFRSERGRNYAKVFRQLLVEITRLRRDQRRRVVIYLITHGQCHLAPELIMALRHEAYLYGIVIQPSGELPEFVAGLDRHQVVEENTLGSRAGRQRRALDIVSEVGTSRAARPPTKAVR